ncbi:MAG: hypothetical protein ACRC6X_07785 [Culicoidibacterales bacterium]
MGAIEFHDRFNELYSKQARLEECNSEEMLVFGDLYGRISRYTKFEKDYKEHPKAYLNLVELSNCIDEYAENLIGKNGLFFENQECLERIEQKIFQNERINYKYFEFYFFATKGYRVCCWDDRN